VSEAEADRELPGAMPEVVLARVVSLVAEALPRTTPLPPPLRKVATFTPQRRARLGAAQIEAALGEDAFRELVATQVAAARPDLAASQDPVDVAADAWLNRAEGWEHSFADAVARLEESTQPRQQSELDRLQRKLDSAEQVLRDLRAENRAASDLLKAENASLRKKLGEARASARRAAGTTEGAVAAAEQAKDRAESALQAAEAESRKFRGQVEELQAALAAARRDVRVDKDEATLRARVLLDTLLEAAQGLRRELALPAVSGTPGERLEEQLATAGTRDPSEAGALGPRSAALLEQYLSMPRARLIIDGYNVSKTAWPESSLEVQRVRLLSGLAPLVARVGAETTVVFDAAGVTGQRPVVNVPRGVKVLFTQEGVIADDVIRDLVAAQPSGRVVVVVSSDAEVARDVVRNGARSMSSEALVGLLGR
jgi:predicted RNA-binding protein with PIN domain